ncbi:MFS transporter [Pelomonas sp. P8]|uniref:MFS transporter n=1 Tax=Pelomonas cellulosilytica TaxID=2906762 RepID=A0ABS8XRZ7_9BURK|nr:MFS transporter [Pelomonas sp. P8]
MPLGLTGMGVLLLCLLVGDLGVSMRERAALPSALELLRRHAASDTTISLLLSTVPAAFSMLLVPLLGYHSDRCRSRLGRRKPFLLVAAPVGGLAMLGLAASPDAARALHAALGPASPGVHHGTLWLFCLCWVAFECAAVSALSLFNGLVNDLVPSQWLGRVFAAFRIVGLLAGITYQHWIFSLTDHHLREVLIGVGLCFCLPLLAMALTVRESPLPAAAPLEPAPRGLRLPFEHVLGCFRYRPYGWAVAAFVLASVTFSPFNTFYLHYAHASGLDKATLGTLTAAGYAVSIGSAFAIGWLADRFGALRVSTVLMAAYCVVAAAGFAGVHDAASFQVFYFAHVVISGAWFTAASSMPMALFPRASFVQFNSTKDLMVVFGAIFLSSLQGPVLDLSGHDYRFTLLAGAVFSALCVGCLMKLQSGPLAADIATRQRCTG